MRRVSTAPPPLHPPRAGISDGLFHEYDTPAHSCTRRGKGGGGGGGGGSDSADSRRASVRESTLRALDAFDAQHGLALPNGMRANLKLDERMERASQLAKGSSGDSGASSSRSDGFGTARSTSSSASGVRSGRREPLPEEVWEEYPSPIAQPAALRWHPTGRLAPAIDPADLLATLHLEPKPGGGAEETMDGSDSSGSSTALAPAEARVLCRALSARDFSRDAEYDWAVRAHMRRYMDEQRMRRLRGDRDERRRSLAARHERGKEAARQRGEYFARMQQGEQQQKQQPQPVPPLSSSRSAPGDFACGHSQSGGLQQQQQGHLRRGTAPRRAASAGRTRAPLATLGLQSNAANIPRLNVAAVAQGCAATGATRATKAVVAQKVAAGNRVSSQRTTLSSHTGHAAFGRSAAEAARKMAASRAATAAFRVGISEYKAGAAELPIDAKEASDDISRFERRLKQNLAVPNEERQFGWADVDSGIDMPAIEE